MSLRQEDAYLADGHVVRGVTVHKALASGLGLGNRSHFQLCTHQTQNHVHIVGTLGRKGRANPHRVGGTALGNEGQSQFETGPWALGCGERDFAQLGFGLLEVTFFSSKHRQADPHLVVLTLFEQHHLKDALRGNPLTGQVVELREGQLVLAHGAQFGLQGFQGLSGATCVVRLQQDPGSHQACHGVRRGSLHDLLVDLHG